MKCHHGEEGVGKIGAPCTVWGHMRFMLIYGYKYIILPHLHSVYMEKMQSKQNKNS